MGRLSSPRALGFLFLVARKTERAHARGSVLPTSRTRGSNAYHGRAKYRIKVQRRGRVMGAGHSATANARSMSSRMARGDTGRPRKSLMTSFGVFSRQNRNRCSLAPPYQAVHFSVYGPQSSFAQVSVHDFVRGVIQYVTREDDQLPYLYTRRQRLQIVRRWRYHRRWKPGPLGSHSKMRIVKFNHAR
jgi:hypothetical protein